MVFRCKFTKIGDIAYVSHLDLLNIINRSINRANIKVKYSAGFNPHPKISFSPALSLGVNSIAEYVDIEMNEEISENDFMDRINKVTPEGIKFTKIEKYEGKASLSAIISHNIYKLTFDKTYNEEIKERVEKILLSEEILVEKKNKKGEVTLKNQRDKIYKIEVLSGEKNIVVLAILQNSPEGSMKIDDFKKILLENSTITPKETVKIASVRIEDGKISEI